MVLSHTAYQAVLLVLLCYGANAVYPDVYDFAIYSGEHLDDTVMPTDSTGVSFLHAVLVVHQTDCKHLIDKYEIYPTRLPMSKNVLLLIHDYQISNTHVWYNFNGGDLRNRFNISNCLDVFFLPRGSVCNSSALSWDQEGDLDFSDWVWKQIEVEVTIHNGLEIGISVQVLQTGQAKGPMAYPQFRLPPGATKVITVYESSLIRIYSEELDLQNRQFIEKHIGKWIVNNTLKIDVVTEPADDVFSDIFVDIQRITTEDDFHALESAWNIMQRHLLNFKQPLIVPQFTETGYKKLQMPAEWFKILHDFYIDNIESRVSEAWTFGESIINQNEVQCGMVWLSEEVKQQVADGLRELLENWAGCELEMTAFYGVREYFGGNILRNHVDRLETHVISAIIQIDKDLGDAEDWLLEVIEYNGNRSTIALEPGEMLLYESTRLIHGRPKPFKGNKYANVFLHYRPKYGWKDLYVHDQNGFTLYFPDSKSEPLMPLNTDLTSMYGFHRKMVDVFGTLPGQTGPRGPGLRKDYNHNFAPRDPKRDEL